MGCEFFVWILFKEGAGQCGKLCAYCQLRAVEYESNETNSS